MKARLCFWYGRSWTLGLKPGGSGSSTGYTTSTALSSLSQLHRGSYRRMGTAGAAAAAPSAPFHAFRRACHACDVWVALQCPAHSGHSEAGLSHTKQKQLGHFWISLPGRHGFSTQFSRA